jgi:hypothetical protein
MGILDDTQTCNGIANEWELCTPLLFESTDVTMYEIVNNPDYKLPQSAPDGNYCPAQGILGDLNNDGLINVLDIIVTVNIILGIQPYNPQGDLNADGGINILDVIFIVNIILGSSS